MRSNQFIKDSDGHYVLNPKLEVIFHALAGASGMVFESCLNHPLDTLKTRYQLISTIETTKTPSVLKMTSTMIRNEGILSIYRGLPMVLLMQCPRGFLKFGTNYSIQHVIHENITFIQNINILNCVSGIGTGIIDGIIVSPFEFIKVRMQSYQYKHIYNNTFSALYHIIWKNPPFNSKLYGFMCLFRGMELTLWRNGLWHGVYFGSLGKQKKASDRFGKSKFHDFLFGCIGGGAGSIFSSPFDVAKSRLQNVSTSDMNYISKNPWALRAVYNVYKDEGFCALYRGFVPKLLRLGLGGGILMFSFEYTLMFIEMVHLFATRQV
eukprot:365646_1